MRVKLVTAAVVAVFSLQFANAYMNTRAVTAPHATTWQVLQRVGRQPYEVRVPHRNLLAQVRFSLVPEAKACGGLTCDATTSKTGCNENCPIGMCGRCPDCNNGPCTIYTCVPGPLNRMCQYMKNPNPTHVCDTCTDSHNVSCTP